MCAPQDCEVGRRWSVVELPRVVLASANWKGIAVYSGRSSRVNTAAELFD